MNRAAFSGTQLRIILVVLLLAALLAAVLLAFARTDIQSLSSFPETMSVWIQWDTNPAGFQALFKDFGEAHATLVEVALQVHPEKITSGLESEDPPDILVVRPSQMVNMANQGLLTPLDDVISAQGIKLDDFYPATLELCQYNGHYYCMPWSTYTLALLWNKDLFRFAGLDPNKPPATMEELAAYAEQLTRVDESGNIIQLGFLPDYPYSRREQYVRMFGGYWYNADATQVTLSSAPMVEALRWQQQFYSKYGAENVLQFKSTLGHYTSPDYALITGKVAMVADGLWMLGPDFIQKYKPDLNFGVAAFPYPADHPERRNTSIVMGSVAVIPAGVQNVDAAGKLLAWMLTPEFQAEFNCMTFNLPVNVHAASAPCFQDDTFRLFLNLISSPNASAQVITPISGDVNQELGQIENLVLHEGADPLPLLQEAEARLQPMLAEAICETEECVQKLVQSSATRIASPLTPQLGGEWGAGAADEPAGHSKEAGTVETPTPTEETEVVVTEVGGEVTPVPGRCGATDINAVDAILIGATAPLSAPGAVGSGLAMRWSMSIAERKINAAGGVLGKPIELVFYDTQGLPERGTSAMERLISQDCVVAVVGGYHSAVGVTMKEAAHKYHIPTLFTETWADEITAAGYEEVFRVAPTSSFVAKSNVLYIERLGDVDFVVIVAENTDYGVPFAETNQRLLAERGIDSEVFLSEMGVQDFSPIIARIQALDRTPDVIIVGVTGEASYNLEQQMAEAGLAPSEETVCLADLSAMNPEFWTNVPDGNYCVFQYFGLTPALASDLTREFEAEYRTKFDRFPESFALASFDSVMLMADAIERAGSLDPDAIIAALEATDINLTQGHYYFRYGAENPVPDNQPDWMWHQWLEPSVLFVQYFEEEQRVEEAAVVWPEVYQTHGTFLIPYGTKP